MFFSVLCLLCICMRLFICALWSPAGKGLSSWLSFVVSSCELWGRGKIFATMLLHFVIPFNLICNMTMF